MSLEHGDPVYTDRIEKEPLKTKNMNKNKSIEVLADEIWNNFNEPKQPTLIEDLKKNSYLFAEPLKEELVLNQAVISYQSMTDSTSTVIMPQRPPGVPKWGVPTSILPYLNIVEGKNSLLSYVFESGKTDGAAVRAEGSIMSQSDKTWTEVTTRASNISGFMDVSNESLKDVEFLKSEIENGLKKEVETVLSTNIINGNGTYPQPSGLLSVGTAFSAGVHAASVPSPSLADVLKVAANQILTAGFSPTLAIVHPDDYTTLTLGSDATRSMPWAVVATTQIATDNYVLLEGSLVMLYLSQQMMKFSTMNKDNAMYERTTVIGNLQANLKIAPNQYTGIVKGVFSTGLAAITAP